MGERSDIPELPVHREIAWDGVSFRVPANWELAVYKFPRRRATRIELEDEYAVRLEAEWIRPARDLDERQLVERYERAARPLTSQADSEIALRNVGDGWTATHYVFKKTEPRRHADGLQVVAEALVTAFYVSPDRRFFCFLLVHFYPEDNDDPAGLARLLTAGFERHDHKRLLPWRLYDVAFETPRDFVLENTLFDVGAKLMVFRWRLRRLHIWHFSCARMFLKDGVVLEEWVAGYLNAFSRIRGIVFEPGAGGEIRWRRKRRHFLGHRDEISRWCFRRKVHCRHDPATDQVLVWVYSYRRDEDLAMIPDSLR